MVGKLKMSTGDYALRVPEHFGPIILEAFIDLDGNMRGDPTDPKGAYSGNPLRIGDNDVWNVNINIFVQEDGKMPGQAAPAGAGGGGMGI